MVITMNNSYLQLDYLLNTHGLRPLTDHMAKTGYDLTGILCCLEVSYGLEALKNATSVLFDYSKVETTDDYMSEEQLLEMIFRKI